MRYWTYYWNGGQVFASAAAATGGDPELVDHTAGTGFAARGVEPGDTVYIINWWHGALRVLGRFLVDRRTDQAGAEAHFGRGLYEAPEHLIAQVGTATPLVIDVEIFDDDRLLDEIQFIDSSGNEVLPKRRSNGSIDPQTYRNVREIGEGTAARFDVLLGFEAVADSPPYRRTVEFELTCRDDIGNEANVGGQVVVAAPMVPPRFVELDYSSTEPGLLQDQERLVEQLTIAAEGWANEQSADIDGDIRIFNVTQHQPLPTESSVHLP